MPALTSAPAGELYGADLDAGTDQRACGELHGADVDDSMDRRAASYSCLSRASIARTAGRLRYAFSLAAARMAVSVVRVVIRSGSVRASISAARPEATERSKAGMNSSVRVTSSPCAP